MLIRMASKVHTSKLNFLRFPSNVIFFLLLDVPTSKARLLDSSGGTRYLDERTCRRVLRTRRNDVENPLHIIKYTRGHYEGVRWPRGG